jgi:Fe-S-cluster containining protein
MRREELQNALDEVRAVYAELAERPLERSCQMRTGCCRFQLTGLTPQLTKGEALVAAKGLRATGRRELPESADGACPLLKRETGSCLIYANRPFGCRTHFCDAAGGP